MYHMRLPGLVLVRIVTGMSVVPPDQPAPVTTVDEAIERMQAIEKALPENDGIACFNRMYLDVTSQVNGELDGGFYQDRVFMTRLDVNFANLYFDAVAKAGDLDAVPLAWRPLVERRADPAIEEIQFALAGMNAHINHDLPIAMVQTCQEMETAPDVEPHYADYQKVDVLLDAAEEAIRRSFEDRCEQAVDKRLTAVANFVCNWGINCARDLAWTNAQLLWVVRRDELARDLFLESLAKATELAGRLLLVAVQ
jgi:uncharacterized protein DUF5995